MPLYEYQCQSCGHRSEELQRFDDPPLTTCGECGGDLKKLLSAPAVQFKGTGWYVTDYAGKKGDPGKGDSGSKKESSDGGSKKESSDGGSKKEGSKKESSSSSSSSSTGGGSSSSD